MSELKELYEKFEQLRVNIRKLGPLRRKDKLGQEKLVEAKSLYSQYESYIDKFSDDVEKSKISKEDYLIVQSFIPKFETVYNKIVGYYQITSQDNSEDETNMANKPNFDLKTAVSLLPIMDGSENVTKQLIDAIDLYSTMIVQTDEQALINFVIKTRLSQSAKLRLSKNYTKVQQLVDDMKKYLIPLKSDTALQKQLLTTRQGNRSIDKFGQELEDLFVKLTISQSKGDPTSYEILRPLNEKLAIHRFADGLRNERLSTVISARDYDTLTEAIQGAKDEEVTMTPTTSSGQLFHVRKTFNDKKGIKSSPYRGNYKRSYYNNIQHSNQGPTRQFRGNNMRGVSNTRYQNTNAFRAKFTNPRYKKGTHRINLVQSSNDVCDPEDIIADCQLFRN